MSFFRRLFDTRARQALDAEVQGDLRKAAYLWVDMGDPGKAAELMTRLGEQAKNVEEKVQAWVDALRFMPPDREDGRRDLEARIGVAVLESARERGAVSADAKRKLVDAAERLERAEKWVEAADCYELLGRNEDLARCLEHAGEIERLEKVLETTHAKEQRDARLRRLVSEQEMATRVGARDVARRALREATLLAPSDPSIAEMLRRIEEKWPRGRRLKLDVGGARVGLVGSLPAVIGRSDADVVVRGGSVSRRHCEIARREDAVVVRDLGSRNGTLIAGVPIAGEIALSGPTEIGLGDDVSLRVSPGAQGIAIDVLRGLDRGERVVAGEAELRVAGLSATFVFVDDRAVMQPDAGVSVVLGAQNVAAGVDLLYGDVITVGGVRVEVLA
ncbi:FHA domain-containing protein [Sandaracinus amylolyticus]|uniref:FHA domain-containing protein n=1 Tax=Sandaracinus amylolyticus TaxID=927083 RepID=UPI001F02837C|nr:FHA domain-containing protein [Sandaracinus amylolyticus]UJR81060.1 FHA domain-containing protein [Sandaracinus amylolyticus]